MNLMMQVIRGGKLEGGAYLPAEHEAIVAAYEAADLERARDGDPRAHRHRPHDRARGDRAGRGCALGGVGGVPLVAGVRCSFRGKDAGSGRIHKYGRDRGRRIGASSAALRLS